ncbi:MAG: mechanosensitive ion channel family protein [Gemella sp.]|nr:mechanosensitive ion channel family protein [Gemella sp.]
MLTYFKDRVWSYIGNPDIYKALFEKILLVIIIVLISWLVIKVLLYIVDSLFEASKKANDKLALSLKTNIKRTDTVHKLVRSVVRYTIYFIAIVQALSVFGINTTGILASAGIVSVAIGFGAQTLVRDIITGFFLIVENQFDVGDYVKISNQAAFIAEGNVMALGLRSTKIRSTGGEVYFIPNSSINQVINYSQTYNLAKVEFPIALESDFASLENEVEVLLEKLNAKDDYTKHFYKKEKLILNAVKNVENDIANLEIIVKAKLGKAALIESSLRRDFYDEFKDRIKKEVK